MKTIFKCPNHFWFALALCAMIFSGCNCSAPKPTPDPLAGFHMGDLANLDSNKAITDDCNNYVKTLSPEEQQRAGLKFFYEDGTGQHAVEIKIGINGTDWEYVLIYDKNNKRIKTIKYAAGGYAC